MYDSVVELIERTESVDLERGMTTTTKIVTQVAYAQVDSISRDEWLAAGEKGLNPAFRFRLPRSSYGGEASLIYAGKTYAVYRTYEAKNEIELYAHIEAGDR